MPVTSPDVAPHVGATSSSGLTMFQVAAFASNAGFKGDEIATAVAIAWAESSGNPNATNRNSNGTTDYGLWQINSIHKDVLGKGKWSDPAANAVMAYTVYSQSGKKFTPWVTYKTGAYLRYLAQAKSASNGVVTADNINSAAGDALNTVTGGAVDSVSSLMSTFQSVIDMLSDPKFWIRVGMFIIGVGLIITGLLRISGMDSTVVSTVTKVATKGVVG